jgi:hypothetical protein
MNLYNATEPPICWFLVPYAAKTQISMLVFGAFSMARKAGSIRFTWRDPKVEVDH